MTKRLNKAVGFVLFLLFVGGIILPALHAAHCTENPAKHVASHCPICQVANTPVITPSPPVAPIVESLAIDNADVQISTLHSASLRDPTKARAPPAC